MVPTSISIRVLRPNARRTASQNALDLGLVLILAIAIVAML